MDQWQWIMHFQRLSFRKGATRWALLAIAWLLLSCQPQSSNLNQTIQSDKSNVRLRVITSGGFAAAYNNLISQIERELNITLVTEYGSSSGGSSDSIPVRLDRGEKFDVIILSKSSLKRLTDNGFVDADTHVDLVRSTIGMAVREGARIPDISTQELFVKSLLEAESIGYSASVSGTYLLEELFPRLGLWDELETKSTRILSERVASVVARGDVEIGFQQVSEILPVAGVVFAGPIPENLQRVTTFSAGVLINSDVPAKARQLLDYLASLELAPEIEKSGLIPVVLETEN